MPVTDVVQRYRLDELQPVALPVAQDRAQRLARGHYENFSVASLLLPADLRPHFYSIYAYCRVSDDLADEMGTTTDALTWLDRWRAQLDALYAGQATHWVFVALQPTIEQFDIPARPFERLLEAFVQDQTKTRYANFDEILGYCQGSANPVGELVLYLARAASPEHIALSDDICTALQITNFWQDVARDWDKGRVYLPQDDMERFGVTEQQIAARAFSPQYADLLRFECERAHELYQRGAPLVDRLPRTFRRDVALFLAGGVSILRAIAAAGYDTLSTRPTLSRWGKLSLALRVLLGGQPWR